MLESSDCLCCVLMLLSAAAGEGVRTVICDVKLSSISGADSVKQ